MCTSIVKFFFCSWQFHRNSLLPPYARGTMFQAQSLLQLVWVVPNPGRPQAAMGLQPLPSLIDQQATSSPRHLTLFPGGGAPRADLEGAVGPIPNPSLLLPSSLLSPCINCRLPAPSIWSLVFGGWAAAAASAWWAPPFRPQSTKSS